MEEQVYFLTVDWCEKGHRGVFCNSAGSTFHKNGKPHTALEMQEILGLFCVVLTPKSEPFTEEQLGEFTFWHPLAEYSGQFGIALKQESDVPLEK